MLPGMILGSCTALGVGPAPLTGILEGVIAATILAALAQQLTGDGAIGACMWAFLLADGALGWRAAGYGEPVRRRAGTRIALTGLALGGLNLALLEVGVRSGLIQTTVFPAWAALTGGLLAIGAALAVGGALAWLAIPAMVAAAVGGLWLILEPLASSKRFVFIWPAIVVSIGAGLYMAAWRLGNQKLRQASSRLTALSLVLLAPRLAGGGHPLLQSLRSITSLLRYALRYRPVLLWPGCRSPAAPVAVVTSAAGGAARGCAMRQPATARTTPSSSKVSRMIDASCAGRRRRRRRFTGAPVDCAGRHQRHGRPTR